MPEARCDGRKDHMQTGILRVTLPKELLTQGLGKEDVNREVGKWLVLALFRTARVSPRKAVSPVGITRRDFLELLDREGSAYLDHS
jgi:hypothetical protein